MLRIVLLLCNVSAAGDIVGIFLSAEQPDKLFKKLSHFCNEPITSNECTGIKAQTVPLCCVIVMENGPENTGSKETWWL